MTNIPVFRSMNLRLLRHALLVACSVLPAWAAAGPVNLVRNGGGEDAASVSDTTSVAASVPHWARADGSAFTTVQYGTPGGFPTPPQGATDGGRNFFAGGPQPADSHATQLADLDGLQGRAFTLAGWFGGFQWQQDAALLEATFLDATDAEIGSVTVGGVGPQARGNVTGLLFRTADGVIPMAATRVRFTLAMDYVAHPNTVYNDAYADNLSFSVQQVPEPGSAGLAGVALALLATLGGTAARRQGRKQAV